MGEVGYLTHGTTIGTNAIVEGKGGKMGLHIMQSNGGSMTVEGAKKYAVQLINSGPAGGAIAAAFISRITGNEMATTSPPFGLILFVMKEVAPSDITMGDIYKARQVSPFWPAMRWPWD